MANFYAPRRSTTGWGRGRCLGVESRVACAQVSRSTREDVGEMVARQCGTHSDIFSFFLWDSPPSEAKNARAHRGVKSCRRKLKNDEVVALWMMGRRLKISGAKKGRGRGGGAGRMPTRNIPHHLFLAQSEYLLVETPAATSAPRAL